MSYSYFMGSQISIGSTAIATSESLNNAPASLMFGYSFIAEGSAMDYFWVNIGAVAGTDANRKIMFVLQTDSSGIPDGIDLAGYEQVGGWTANTVKKIIPGWNGVTLMPGNRYWIVCKNTAAAPGTDYVGFARIDVPMARTAQYNVISAPFVRRQYNGSNWTTTLLAHFTAVLIKYSDGGLSGMRHRAGLTYNPSWCGTTTRQVGAQISLPQHSPTLNIVGIGLAFLTPNPIKIQAFINRSFVAESIWSKDLTLGGNVTIITLPIHVTAQPGDTIQLISNPGAWSNLQPAGEVIPDEADFLILKPWGASVCKLEAGAWSVDPLQTPSLTLYLDQSEPFLAPPINRRQYYAQR